MEKGPSSGLSDEKSNWSGYPLSSGRPLASHDNKKLSHNLFEKFKQVMGQLLFVSIHHLLPDAYEVNFRRSS